MNRGKKVRLKNEKSLLVFWHPFWLTASKSRIRVSSVPFYRYYWLKTDLSNYFIDTKTPQNGDGGGKKNNNQRSSNNGSRSKAPPPKAVSSATQGSNRPQERSHGDKSKVNDHKKVKDEKRIVPIFADFSSPVKVLTRWNENDDSYWLVQELSDGVFKRGDSETQNLDTLYRYFNWSRPKGGSMDEIDTMVQLLFSILTRDGVINAVQQDCVNRIFQKMLHSNLFSRDADLFKSVCAQARENEIFANQLAVIIRQIVERFAPKCFTELVPISVKLRPHDELFTALRDSMVHLEQVADYYRTHGDLPSSDSGSHQVLDSSNKFAKSKPKSSYWDDGPSSSSAAAPNRYWTANDPGDAEFEISLSALPNAEDIESTEDLPVRSLPSLTADRFLSANHYLDTMWRLLRADALEDIRIAIRTIRIKIAEHSKAIQGALRAGTPVPAFQYPRSASFFAYTDVRIKSFAVRREYGGANDAAFIVSFKIVSSQGALKASNDAAQDNNDKKKKKKKDARMAGAKVEWKLSRRLMPGSLVALTCDNFNTFLWGTVAGRDENLLNQGCAIISLEPNSIAKFDRNHTYEMLETRAFWTSYGHVLNRLASFYFPRTLIREDDEGELMEYEVPRTAFPLQDIIIYGDYNNIKHVFPREFAMETVAQNPQDRASVGDLQRALALPVQHAAIANAPADDRAGLFAGLVDAFAGLRLNGRRNENAMIYPRDKTILDEAQWEALKCILTQRVSVVQGPPGTGKTFLGLKATEILLKQFDGPILCVCYTNHALDQFLEGIIKFERSVVRIGGRCKTEALKPFVLQELYKSAQYSRSISNQVRRREECRQCIHSTYKLSNSVFAPIYAFLRNMSIVPTPRNGHKLSQEDYILRALELFDLPPIGEPFKPQASSSSSLSSNNRLASYSQHNRAGTSANFFSNLEMDEVSSEADSDASEEEINAMLAERDWDYSTDAGSKRSWLEGDGNSSEGEEATKQEKAKLSAKRLESKIGEFDYTNTEGFTLDLDMDGVYLDDDYPGVPFTNRDWILRNASADGWLAEFKRDGMQATASKNTFIKVSNALSKGDLSPAAFTADIWRSIFAFWMDHWKKSISEQVAYYTMEFNKIVDKIMAYQEDAKADFLRKKRVIGMTTTGAAKHANLLSAIGCKVIIIEEAAEIFEAHAVSCLSSGVEKLILIGDHYQLRPKVNYYPLVKRGLDISLFERLIMCGFPYVALRQQHRMHPEISRFLKPIYPTLYNGPKTSDRMDLTQLGLLQRAFFFKHNWVESGGNNEEMAQSKQNPAEASFIYGFVRYLVSQGTDPNHIAVITMYKGQQRVLKDLMTRAQKLPNFASDSYTDPRTALVRVCCVDDYQGEENEIIVVSLVRSNQQSSIGFVDTKNRVCVALSRARSGMFVFGSVDTIESSCAKKRKFKRNEGEETSIWPEILSLMNGVQAVKDTVELCCPKHKDVRVIKRTTADWKDMFAGCPRPCNERRECGHTCKLVCHGNSPHPPCFEPCAIIHENCGHPCLKMCHESCGRCLQKVSKSFPSCGHTVQVNCFEQDLKACTAPCEKVLRCGHRCPRICSQTCATKCLEVVHNVKLPCGHVLPHAECWETKDLVALSARQHPCGARLADCQHVCSGNCADCRRTNAHVACEGKCDRSLPCKHLCKGNCAEPCPPCLQKCELKCSHSPCRTHTCGTRCTPCMEKCTWACPHRKCTQHCSDPCDREPCNEFCEKRLKCGHPCLGLCGERCPPVCYTCSPKVEVFGSAMMASLLEEEVEYKTRFIFLEKCRHSIAVEVMDRWMETLDKPTAAVALPACPMCNSPIVDDFGRYSNFIKKRKAQLDDIRIIYAKQHIKALFKKGRYQGALDKIRELHTKSRFGHSALPPPKFVEMLVIKAMSLKEMHADDKDVESACREILAIDPNNEDAIKIQSGLTKMEDIVNAMRGEIKPGAWYNCPNGHPYTIGECGGAMEESKCPDCGAVIGGANHASAAGNTHSSIDGSRHSAYGNEANMANYNFDDLH